MLLPVAGEALVGAILAGGAEKRNLRRFSFACLGLADDDTDQLLGRKPVDVTNPELGSVIET
jgi:hypothetical protein